MDNQYTFSIYDENWNPVFYTGIQKQMVHRADGKSLREAREKAKSHFKGEINLQLIKVNGEDWNRCSYQGESTLCGFCDDKTDCVWYNKELRLIERNPCVG